MFSILKQKSKNSFNEINILDKGESIRARYKETVLEAAIKAGIDFPFQCGIGSCGECKCRVVEGNFKTLMDLDYMLTPSEINDRYTLACQTIATSAITIDIETNLERKRTISHGIVNSCEPISRNIYMLEIKTESKISHVPGQYIKLSLPGLDIPRAYSLVNNRDSANGKLIRVHIALQPNGKISNWIKSHTNLGSSVTVEGPFGNFTLPENQDTALFVAGGSGLGVCVSMIQDSFEREKKRRIHLIFLVREKEDIHLEVELEQLSNQFYDLFTYNIVVTKQTNPLSESPLATAINSYAMVDPIDSNTLMMICGSQGLIDTCKDIGAKLGVSNNNVFFDSFLQAR